MCGRFAFSAAGAEWPMFRRGFAEHRRVIPMTGFYEYDSNHIKYFFGDSGEPLYLAGISEAVEGGSCFAVLTTAPNLSMADIHDRMPLDLRREQMRLLTAVPPLLHRTCLESQMAIMGF